MSKNKKDEKINDECSQEREGEREEGRKRGSEREREGEREGEREKIARLKKILKILFAGGLVPRNEQKDIFSLSLSLSL